MIRNFFKTEWSKMRQMTFTEKRQYIWEYYKVQIFTFIFVAFLLGSLINVWFINPPKREYLYLAWLSNNLITSTQLNHLGENLNIIVPESYHEEIRITSYTFISDNPDHNIALQTRFFALLQTGAIDILFTEKEALGPVAASGLTRPVHDVMAEVSALNPELYQLVTERLVTVTFVLDDEAQTEITDVMGISLDGAPLFEYLRIPTDDLYIAVVINTNKFDRIAAALEIIFKFEEPVQ